MHCSFLRVRNKERSHLFQQKPPGFSLFDIFELAYPFLDAIAHRTHVESARKAWTLFFTRVKTMIRLEQYEGWKWILPFGYLVGSSKVVPKDCGSLASNV